MNIAKIMIPKISTVFLHERQTVRQGWEVMTRGGYTAIPVLDDEERYIGSVTEGDFLRYVFSVESLDKLDMEKYRVGELVRREFCPSVSSLLSAYLTAVPGVSSVYELGVTSYSCRIKNEVLGVKSSTLNSFGAVSSITASEMAEGIRKKASADFGVSVTGVAGPDGSEGHNPGLVYIAVADQKGTAVKRLDIDAVNRDYVRSEAVKNALELLINNVKEVK